MNFAPNYISDQFIQEPGTDRVFVFGSNEQGIHGKGAAKFALKMGAIRGVGEGLQGKTYAFPTRRFVNGKLHTLPLVDIEINAYNFMKATLKFPDKQFYMTSIGIGLAGIEIPEMVTAMRPAIEHCRLNVHWPPAWHKEVQDIFSP